VYVSTEEIKPVPKVEKPNKHHNAKDAIENLLQNEHWYLTKSYSIAAMSDELEIPVHILSTIINHEYQLNFRDLINQYRVEYIITPLTGKRYPSILLKELRWKRTLIREQLFTGRL
jgi:AraC-like DNA-binding protein